MQLSWFCWQNISLISSLSKVVVNDYIKPRFLSVHENVHFTKLWNAISFTTVEKSPDTLIFILKNVVFCVALWVFQTSSLVNGLVLFTESLQVSSQSVADDAWELWVKARIYLGQVLELWISTCHWYDFGWMNLQSQSIAIQSKSADHSTNKLFEFRTSRHQVHV